MEKHSGIKIVGSDKGTPLRLFLTGDFDVGKTFIADRCLERWHAQGRGPVWGFRTYKETHREETLIRLTDPNRPEALHTVARFTQSGRELFPEVFDKVGVPLLRRIGPETKGLVLMDEIGYIESGAPGFRAEIERVLELDIPVLGVLRKRPSPFLSALAIREDLTLFEVDLENREAMARHCFELLGL